MDNVCRGSVAELTLSLCSVTPCPSHGLRQADGQGSRETQGQAGSGMDAAQC